jgi:asparagine synthase (glutamine-hydrolysing)
MQWRGPDRQRVWCDGPVGLAHALMRVTEEDTFDRQPLVDSDAGVALVADLRLDNRETLAQRLGIDSAALPGLPDSALLMAAYRKWGEDCAEHLVGDFAFTIWDARLRKLVLGRDHMGARYIHFHRGADFFVFATEKKGLWALADVPRRLNEVQLGKFLALDFAETAAATLYEEISGLFPSTVLTLSENGVMRSRRYWEPRADPSHVGRNEAYYIESYRRVLAEAVACRLRRNVRSSALMLSGGFDSAAIAALAEPVMAKQKRKLIALSSVMPSGYRGPIPHARKWVEACERHMPHLDVHYLTLENIGLLDDLEESFLRTDNSGSANRVATIGLFSAAAKSGARVVMDGHGGDYTLNPRARGWLGKQLRRGRLRTVLRELIAYRRNRDMPFSSVLRRELIWPLLPASARRLWQRLRGSSPQKAPQILNPEFLQAVLGENGQPRSATATAPSDTEALMSFLLAIMQDGVQSASHGAASMYGLEFTQPFHDKRVVELALAIPQFLFVRNGRSRYLARKALADLYPPEILARTDGNDSRTPGFLATVERAKPELFAEVGRMEKKEKLRRYFDFTRVQEMLAEPVNARLPAQSEMHMRHAIRAIIMARFIEWNDRDNR